MFNYFPTMWYGCLRKSWQLFQSATFWPIKLNLNTLKNVNCTKIDVAHTESIVILNNCRVNHSKTSEEIKTLKLDWSHALFCYTSSTHFVNNVISKWEDISMCTHRYQQRANVRLIRLWRSFPTLIWSSCKTLCRLRFQAINTILRVYSHQEPALTFGLMLAVMLSGNTLISIAPFTLSINVVRREYGLR